MSGSPSSSSHSVKQRKKANMSCSVVSDCSEAIGNRCSMGPATEDPSFDPLDYNLDWSEEMERHMSECLEAHPALLHNVVVDFTPSNDFSTLGYKTHELQASQANHSSHVVAIGDSEGVGSISSDWDMGSVASFGDDQDGGDHVEDALSPIVDTPSVIFVKETKMEDLEMSDVSSTEGDDDDDVDFDDDDEENYGMGAPALTHASTWSSVCSNFQSNSAERRKERNVCSRICEAEQAVGTETRGRKEASNVREDKYLTD